MPLLSTLLLLLGIGDEPVRFERDVWPILERHCVYCHGPIQHYSSLRLDSPERIGRGGDLGAVVSPGRPEESPLYLRTTLPADDLDVMPVEAEPLSEEEQELLRRWIAEGAEYGDWTGTSPQGD